MTRTDPVVREKRKTMDLPPGINRFYPAPRTTTAQLRELGRWNRVMPNRKDRRRAARGLNKAR